MATPGGFSLGISAEEKLSLPLDALIKKAKQQKPKVKKPVAKKTPQKPQKPRQQKPKKQQNHKLQNVKKTVLVPVSKAARARAHAAVSSAKRQNVMNKRRPGLVLAAKKGKKLVVQLRPHKTSAARKPHKKQGAGGLDVSNIINHFRTHPKKFDVPKGSNLRITINLNNVKPVVGGQK